MKYAQIRDMDISNGVGIACSIFFQGCTHHCVECFQPETWSFNNGFLFTEQIQNKFIELCKQPYIKCVSLLGGEPFDQDRIELYKFLYNIKTEVDKPVFIWSGYTFEELINDPVIKKLFDEELIQVLIDGEFDINKKNLNLKLRGSSNQRIIDVKKTMQADGEIVLYPV